MADSTPPTPEAILKTARQLRALAPSLRAMPTTAIVEALGATGMRFLDSSDELRREALAGLPESSGVSAPMARAILDGMAADWTTSRLTRLIEAEFGGAGVLDHFVADVSRMQRAIGAALTVQIVSGSVPGVGVSALIRSLLVRSPTLLKAGAGDTLLPELFERGLRETAPDLASALAVRYWPGDDDGGRTASALRHAEVAVVYGSDRTVQTIRSIAPATTRLVEYRHREAVALVTREVLEDTPAESAAGPPGASAAREVAIAVSMFDQRGCVCPHLVLVEEGGAVTAEAFADLLADALAEVAVELPPAESRVEERAAVQQLRGVAEVQAATHGGFVKGGESGWTVAFEPRAVEGPPTMSRGVRVRPADFSRLSESLGGMMPHLQSVGVAGPAARRAEIADTVGLLGASRVVPMGRLAFPPAWWLHDGRGPLRELVRWVEIEAD